MAPATSGPSTIVVPPAWILREPWPPARTPLAFSPPLIAQPSSDCQASRKQDRAAARSPCSPRLPRVHATPRSSANAP